MTDLDETVSLEVRALARDLLESARDDAPPPREAVGRAAVALGLTAVTLSGAAEAAGAGAGMASLAAGAKATSIGAVTMVKWIAVGSMVAAAGLGGVEWVTHAAQDRSQATPSEARVGKPRTTSSSPRSPAESRPGEAGPGLVSVPEPTTRTLPSSAVLARRSPENSALARDLSKTSLADSKGPTHPPQPDNLATEVSLLDQARGQLGQGRASAARDLLNSYHSRFPRGALRAEALAMTIEVWLNLGDREEAKRWLLRLERAYPESQQLRRFSALRGQQIE